MSLSNRQINHFVKPPLFLALLLPALWLFWQWWLYLYGGGHSLGFNPEERSNLHSGEWAIRILLLSLGVSPFAKLIKNPKPVLVRRMVGLFAFFYVCLHITSYVWFDKLLAWHSIWADIYKRPYITIGLAAFILLIPLAVTSSRKAVKRLGAKHWARLHKSVYLIGVLAVVHFIWVRKGFQSEPLIYAAILITLLAARLPFKKWQKRTTKNA